MAASANVERLLDSIYAAAIEPSQWPVITHRLAAWLGCSSAMIHARGDTGIAILGVTPNMDDRAQAEYASYYATVDPWAASWRRNRLDGVHCGSDFLDPRSFGESQFYQDFTRRLGIFHWLGTTVPAGGNSSLVLSLHRPADRRDFSRAKVQQLHGLLPHLQRAARVQGLLSKLQLEQRASVEALDRLHVAIVLTNPEARVVFANRAAEEILRSGDGLTVSGGRLRAASFQQDLELRLAIQNVTEIAHGKIASIGPQLRLGGHKGPLLVAIVAPLAAERDVLVLGGASAMVIIAVPQPPGVPPAVELTAIYGLTPAELRLVTALSSGERLSMYAERARISVNTARAHLKQVFSKTGTSRQAELISLVTRSFVTRP